MIIQKFDPQNIPQISIHLLREFRLYLADLDIKSKRVSIKQEQRIRMYNKSNNFQIPRSYQWIEDLLQIPIQDHRKFTIDLVLAPYLINIRYHSFDQAFSIISDWTLKCGVIRTLEPSVNDFLDVRIKLSIHRSTRNHIPPIKRETIRENYSEWYKDFKEWHLFS